MKKYWLLLMIPVMMLTACGKRENPFFSEYKTPFGVPPFDKIENAHFEPAFLKGIEEHAAEIQAIVDNPEPPTFENTIEALEHSGELLGKVGRVFWNFNSSLTSPELQQIAQKMSPKLSEHSSNISLNLDLFARIKAVYEQKDELDLNPEQRKLLEETHKGFVRSGANLPAEQQARLREISSELSMLTLQFGQNVLGETNAFTMVVDNEADLAGLPDTSIENAADLAASMGKDGKWVFTLHNPSVMPFLYNADNRELRKKMQQAHVNRGNNDNEFNNRETLAKIANLRLERAQMMGYETFADFSLEETMAGSTETVMNFVNQVWQPAIALAKQEAKLLQEMIYEDGHDFKLEQWDWRYYAERVRREKYDLDEQLVRQYFELNTVRDGIFMIVDKLWGLQFVERNDVPKYHPDVQVFEVLEADGSHVGILYMDFHPRDSKRGGAWMSSYRSQRIDPDGRFIHPVITIVCNFSPPTSTRPSLLTYDEMTTFFHEFGHALHGLLSDVQYGSLSGTSVPRDFVELPSQIMENWANEPEVMKTFALHYETGEPMPEALMDRIVASAHFNQGFATVEFLMSTYLDMEYHTITTPFAEDMLDDVSINVERETIKKYGMIPQINYRWQSTNFQHIFSGGYAAGYYSYLWSGLLDADAYEAFVETGDVYDQATAQSFRENILERGGTEDAMQMYVNFRGREPIIEPLLRQRGLK
ncbi:MAG: M3 family metallopeptidase [Bacteroidales bacterium]|nr:M3 family metallopeptidase [Bacteroidales bacterium]